MKKVLFPIVIVVLFITAIGILQNRFEGSFYNPLEQTTKPSPTPETKVISVAGSTLTVEIADSNEKRREGFSGKKSLSEGNGMVFVFEGDSRPSFWMKDMNFAIDIIWVKDEKIVGIEKNVQPEPGVSEKNLTLYPAPQAIDHVIEVNAGYSEKNNLEIGDSVDLSSIN